MQLSSRDTRNTGILDRWTGRYWRKRSCGITRAKFTWRRRTAAGTGACPTCTIHLFYLYRHSPRHAPVPPARYTCLTYTLTGTLSGTYLSNLQDTPVLPVHSHALSQARTCHNCNYTPVHLYTPGTLSGTHLSHLYEVIEEEEVVVTSQWDMAGSLLFAITVITTIGTHTMRYICIYTGARMAPWLTQNVAQRR